MAPPTLAPQTHVTALPRGFIIVRILQFLFTLVAVALSIFLLKVRGTFDQIIVTVTV